MRGVGRYKNIHAHELHRTGFLYFCLHLLFSEILTQEIITTQQMPT